MASMVNAISDAESAVDSKETNDTTSSTAYSTKRSAESDESANGTVQMSFRSSVDSLGVSEKFIQKNLYTKPYSELGEFGSEEALPVDEIQEPLVKSKTLEDLKNDSDITWLEPESLEYISDSEEDSDDIVLSDMVLRMRAESTDRIYLRDDVKEVTNFLHGYTLVEERDEEGFGRKVTRTFYPRIYKKIRSYRKKLPMTIFYNKLTADETGVMEEEDVVDEEMDVDEITETILVKTKDENGNEIEKPVEIQTTRVHDPSKPKKYLKLHMINDKGQVITELVELTEDMRRTQDIMKAATPYLKKKLKEKSIVSSLAQEDLKHEGSSLSKSKSCIVPGWTKDRDTLHAQTLNKAIMNLKRANDDQKMLKKMNKYLGNKICQYYDLKGKKDPEFNYNPKSENAEEEKTNYKELLLEFGDVVNFIFSENKMREQWITMSAKGVQNDSDELTNLRKKFYNMEETLVRDLKPEQNEGKANKTMTLQDIINRQKLMDNNLAKVRYEHINSTLILEELKEKEAKFQNSIDNLEQVDFINFETMRAKTKDLNDKLDLKEKQIMTMKDTMTQRVQALAHVRLKKESLTTENEKLKEEKQLIEEELKKMRKESVKVQQERRKLEKKLETRLMKDGLERYPYLLKEAPHVAAKHDENRELLSNLVNRCTDMQNLVRQKLREHQEGADRYRKIKEQRHPRRKLISFESK